MNLKGRIGKMESARAPQGKSVTLSIRYCDEVDGSLGTVDTGTESDIRFGSWRDLPNGFRVRIAAPKTDPIWRLTRSENVTKADGESD